MNNDGLLFSFSYNHSLLLPVRLLLQSKNWLRCFSLPPRNRAQHWMHETFAELINTGSTKSRTAQWGCTDFNGGFPGIQINISVCTVWQDRTLQCFHANKCYKYSLDANHFKGNQINFAHSLTEGHLKPIKRSLVLSRLNKLNRSPEHTNMNTGKIKRLLLIMQTAKPATDTKQNRKP